MCTRSIALGFLVASLTLTSTAFAQSGPIRVVTEYELGPTEIDSNGGVISEETVIGAGGSLSDDFRPWSRSDSYLDLLREVNESRGLSTFIRDLIPADPPNPVEHDWWWTGNELNPTPELTLVGPAVEGQVGYWLDPPPHPSPIDPYASRDLLQSIEVFSNIEDLQLGFGEFALLRSSLSFEPGMLDEISQQPSQSVAGVAGDGLMLDGEMELLVYDSEQQEYRSVMTAPLSSYTLETPKFGDLNFDGEANGRDFLFLQQHSGSAFGFEQLANWISSYGDAGAAASIAAVPEPATLALLAMGMSAIALNRPSR